MTVQNNNNLHVNWIINELPNDCTLRIFQKTEVKDIVHNLSLTCKKWNVLSSEEGLWQIFCVQKFCDENRNYGNNYISKQILAQNAQKISFLDLYKCTHRIIILDVGVAYHPLNGAFNNWYQDRYRATLMPYINKASERLQQASPELKECICLYSRVVEALNSVAFYHRSGISEGQ